jgi:3-deoxy-D-manno-octulosonic-acid transferase
MVIFCSDCYNGNMLLLLDVIYLVFLLLLSPWLLARALIHGRYRRGWKDRLGFVPRRYSLRPCVWIHAVSLGEVNAAASLIKAIEKFLPQYEIVISSTTDTGFNRAAALYARSHRVFFFPWDFSRCVRLAFDRVHPQMCILMELEVWHNFTSLAAKKAIPLIVANGRISSGKGFPRYRRVAWLVRPMFRRLSLVLAQNEVYADRFAYLGVPRDRITIAGSLKYDTAEVCDRVEGAEIMARQIQLKSDDRLFVAGSTGPGEEEMMLRSLSFLKEQLPSPPRIVLVPRKPERFNEVARLIESQGLNLIRYSQLKAAGDSPAADTPLPTDAVILGDTMGDLRKFYSLADAVFVGRSLVPMGGSDMIEAAALAKPVLVGPYTENFAETVDMLTRADAITIVQDEGGLALALQRLFEDGREAKQMGLRAQQAIVENQGATQKSIEAIVHLLGYQMPLRPTGIAAPSAISAGAVRNK